MSDKLQEADQVPRSGCDLQPRVAVAATLGIEFQSASTPMGLRPLHTSYTQHSRRAATLGWRSQPLRGINLRTLKCIVDRAGRRLPKTDPSPKVSGEHSRYVALDFWSRYGASTLPQSLVRLIQRRGADDA